MSRSRVFVQAGASLLLLVAVMMAGGVLSEAYAMIPLYAHDYQNQIFDSSGTPYNPEVARLIRENAVVYNEGAAAPGDAYYFDEDVSGKIHYWGFSNYNYGGAGYLERDPKIMEREDLFFHATDPSTLTGWRKSAEEVELHWTWDLRFVPKDGFSSSPPDGAVSKYMIRRKSLFPPSSRDTVLTGINTFVDTPVASSVAYTYEIFSVSSSNDTLEFSKFPAVVGVFPDTRPHFWAEKEDLVEDFYYRRFADGNTGAVFQSNFYLNCDQSVDADSLCLERYTGYLVAGKDTWETITAEDSDNPVHDFMFPFTAAWDGCPESSPMDCLKHTGGVSYRYRYIADGDTTYYPPERGGRKHFISAGRNNRTMGCGWPEYLINVGNDDWWDICSEVASQLEGPLGVDSGYGAVEYDGIFLDTAFIMDSLTHNVVRPYELTDINDNLQASVDGIKEICDATGTGFKVYVNTTSLALLEAMDGYLGFTGAMIEGYVNEPEGESALANAIRRIHNCPSTQSIFMNSMDYGNQLANRAQVIGAYLLSRESVARPSTTVFGCGVWYGTDIPGIVNILPEQMLNIGDEVGSDPFATTIWPDIGSDPDEWPALVDSNRSARIWLAGNTTMVDTTTGLPYAIREFDLIDDIAEENNSVFAIYPFFDLACGYASINDFFPEKSVDTTRVYYMLDYSPDSPQDLVQVTEGGRINTVPVRGDSMLCFAREKVVIAFTAPVKSPEIVLDEPAIWPTTANVEVTMEVRASHWNGQRLDELRFDGTPLGLGPELLLHDDGATSGDAIADDSIYTWSGTSDGFAAAGTRTVPIVATGSDGLMYFAELPVEVHEPPVFSDHAIYALPRGGGDSAILAIEAYSGTPGDSLIVIVDASAIGDSASVALNDSGENGDYASGDGIWSARLSGVSSTEDTRSLPIVVEDEHLTTEGLVEVYIVEPMVSKMMDVSGQTDALQVLLGQPYSAITLNVGKHLLDDQVNWGLEDLFVSVLDDDAKLFAYVSAADSVPKFELRQTMFATGSAPGPRHRGLAVGDYNNDGYEDVFAAHESSPKLYCWSDSSGEFINAPGDIVFDTVSNVSALNLPSPNYSCASWGDYNQDGWLDLVIGWDLYDYPYEESEDGVAVLAAPPPGGNNCVYRNDHGKLIYDSELGGIGGNAFSTSWIDYNRDGALDLFIGDYFGNHTKVYYNLGYSGDYAFTEDPNSGSIISASSLVSGEFADIDNDGDFDFICAGQDDLIYLSIFETTPASGAGTFPTRTQLDAGAIRPFISPTGLNGAITADFDLDGYLDILTLPSRDDQTPKVLLNERGGGSSTFARSAAFDKVNQGPLIGAVGHDWNGDGDIDLFVGRAPAAEDTTRSFFFQNRRNNSEQLVEELENVDFVRVRCVRDAMGNMAAIGSVVEVFEGSELVAPTQYVSGGEGRGSQRSRTLTFGLVSNLLQDDYVTVKVTWPDGFVEEFTDVPINNSAIQVLHDTRVPGIDTSSVAATTEMRPGMIDWTFEWESNIPLTDPRVTFIPGYSGSMPCFCGVAATDTIRLTDQTYNVETDAELVENGCYRYTLSWADTWCCSRGCMYEYEVSGRDGDTIYGKDVWYTKKTPKLCVSGF
jgi:ASPIC and UnbV/FG-GAP-like repeat